eukprot:evm.model.scf_219.1 EVM.evm.TU.scf_219.1   scf_219:5663-11493(+)
MHARARVHAFAPVAQGPLDARRPPRIRTSKHDKGATLYEVLDTVPFTPSMGVCTPTPTNMAVFRQRPLWSAPMESPVPHFVGSSARPDCPSGCDGYEGVGCWAHQSVPAYPPPASSYHSGSCAPPPPASPDLWMSHSTSPVTPQPAVPPCAPLWSSRSPTSPQPPWAPPLTTAALLGGLFLPSTAGDNIWRHSPPPQQPSVREPPFSGGPAFVGRQSAHSSAPGGERVDEQKTSPNDKKGKSKGQQCPEVGPNGELKLNARYLGRIAFCLCLNSLAISLVINHLHLQGGGGLDSVNIVCSFQLCARQLVGQAPGSCGVLNKRFEVLADSCKTGALR